MKEELQKLIKNENYSILRRIVYETVLNPNDIKELLLLLSEKCKKALSNYIYNNESIFAYQDIQYDNIKEAQELIISILEKYKVDSNILSQYKDIISFNIEILTICLTRQTLINSLIEELLEESLAKCNLSVIYLVLQKNFSLKFIKKYKTYFQKIYKDRNINSYYNEMFFNVMDDILCNNGYKFNILLFDNIINIKKKKLLKNDKERNYISKSR